MMKAIVWTKYGTPDVLQRQEVEKPTPKDDEILVKIHATTVTAGDCEARSLSFPFWLSIPMRLFVGVRKPTRVKILGQELAGEIEAIGKEVTQFKEGDAVFAVMGFTMGAYAEYICLSEKSKEMGASVAPKPANMSFEEAAAVPVGGLEAVHFLRKGNVKPGDKVLINGAGGSIGTMGVQLAKYYGAEVTAVDHTDKLDMLRALGADHVIDYTQEDFTQNGKTYDVIFDIIGKSPFAGSVEALRENGRYLIANPSLSKMVRGSWVSMRSNKTVIFQAADHKVEDLIFLKELIEAGKLKSVIDKRYPLAQIQEAHHYVETGRKKGCVVITVAEID